MSVRALKLLRRTIVSTLVVAGAGGVAGHAQAASDSSESAAAPSSPTSLWKVGAGAGLYIAPSFPGSAGYKVYGLPVQDISWDDRVFSQGLDVLGFNVLSADDYHLGASISFDLQSRTASDDARLRGLPDVHWGPKLRVFADYTWWAFTGSVQFYQDIGGTGQGRTAITDLLVSDKFGGLLLSVGPGFTWGNAEYTQTFFGVTPGESARSNFSPYATGSGVTDVHLNVDAQYDFLRRWSAGVAIDVARLERYAAQSPITERRLQVNVLASTTYRF